MTQVSYGVDQQSVNVAKALVGLAVFAALTAAVAGLVLVIANPDSGSTMESTLGITAAVAGLSTAAFAIAALIYAQVKNLWEIVPVWIRTTAWVILAAVAVINVIRSLV